MSYKTKNPHRWIGANGASGNIDTGEMPTIRGGTQAASIWSGNLLAGFAAQSTPGALSSGGHVLFYSGAGRLNSVMAHTQMVSGVPVYFYDAATLTVSGISVSGQRIIGVLPNTQRAGQWSGHVTDPFLPILNLDCPFTSGLCAATPSGTPGFTITFTPELPSPTNPAV